MQQKLVELDVDHPGFLDEVYVARRNDIARVAADHKLGQTPPRIDYRPTEVDTWRTVLAELTKLYPTHACAEYNDCFKRMKFDPNTVSQHADLSEFLEKATGFRIMPVQGLVSAREFLGFLAQRVFPATQYIRHHSAPHYTPEPDVIHELLGHVPMLAVKEYADLSQKFGEYSLRASDAQVDRLSRLYWYTVEFGVVRQNGQIRAYGAGLLSSFGELSRTVAGKNAEFRPFVAAEAAETPYCTTSYQPLFFEVPSIRDAFEQSCGYAETLLRR